jgi:thiamine-monophosphate kinase
MKLSHLGEFGLIEKIRRATPVGRGIRIGIGDDAAWVDNPTGSSLITSDLLIEGVHFNLRWTSLFELGYKSLAVNLSDIAAMGGVPKYVILSLGIPADFDSKKIQQFYRGIYALAKRSGTSLIGGDTNVSKSLIISVCVIGYAPWKPIRRGGAQVGDDIYVTGTLGDSALVLALLHQKKRPLEHNTSSPLLARHHRPTPRLAAGAVLARKKLATAMIDVSDGLLQDLGHICKASGTGALIWNERIPLSRSYRAFAGNGKVFTYYALIGGEDYELLFCAKLRDRARIRRIEKVAQVAITRIGRCVPAKDGISVIDSSGNPIPTTIKGYDHFRKN